MALMKLCAYPGCRKAVPIGQKYCELHKAKGEAHEAKVKAMLDRKRTERKGSSTKRGYGYKWQQLRARVLAEHPYCVECAKHGVMTLATDVDHIVPHRGDRALMWDINNLQSLCHECHSKKTAKEDGAFGNPISHHIVQKP